MVVVLIVAIVVGGLVLLKNVWIYTGRRGNRRGGADGITENKQQ